VFERFVQCKNKQKNYCSCDEFVGFNALFHYLACKRQWVCEVQSVGDEVWSAGTHDSEDQHAERKNGKQSVRVLKIDR